MVIDSSAFVAIVVGELERQSFSQSILADPTRMTSAATLLETSVVVLARKAKWGFPNCAASSSGLP